MESQRAERESTPMKHGLGLVIGKFYPPHRGHKLLIDAAIAQSDQAVVIVCAKPTDTIPRTAPRCSTSVIVPRLKKPRLAMLKNTTRTASVMSGARSRGSIRDHNQRDESDEGSGFDSII